MRRTFGRVLYELMKEDNNIILICGDIGFGIFDNIQRDFPDRFINIGTCEQSMIGMAAGMALYGLKPYVYTITPFLIERAFEQVKIDINMNNANVKLIGYDDYADQGETHVITNGGDFMRLFKNINCYWPLNSRETESILLKTYKNKLPAFIRLRNDARDIKE